MLPAPFTPVVRFSQNTRGRDFVVGDIHGVFDLVLAAMARLNFDGDCDRLFSAGDTVDRGVRSRDVRSFLSRPGVYAVRGNHEQMALQFFGPDGELARGERSIDGMRTNGMGWWLDLSPAERLPILRTFERLPLAFEIETVRGTVGIIHADVPPNMSWPTFLELLEAGDPHATQTCLWGRDRVEADLAEGVPGVGRIFVGHSPQMGGLKRLGNVYLVDTGAVFGHEGGHSKGALTMANVVTGTAVLCAQAPILHRLNAFDDLEATTTPFSSGPGYVGVTPAQWLLPNLFG